MRILRRGRTFISSPGTVIGLSVSALAQQKDTTNSQVAQQLEASGRTSDEGFNKGDATAIAALFTQDAVLILQDGPILRQAGHREMARGRVPEFAV